MFIPLEKINGLIIWVDQFPAVDNVISEALEMWNIAWTKRTVHEIQHEDVSVRFCGNINPLPNLEDGTLSTFYHTHLKEHNSESYFGRYVGECRRPPLPLEIVIDISDFEGRTHSKAPEKFQTPKRGRHAVSDDADDLDEEDSTSGHKRQRKSSTRPGPLVSQFEPRHAQTVPPSSAQRVTLRVAHFELDAKGAFHVDWTPENASIIKAVIEKDAVNVSGRMKKVYNISLFRGSAAPEPWVAKRFVNIGNGVDAVTPKENQDQLQAEASRICLGKAMLAAFYDRASETGTRISKAFNFTEIILVSEVYQCHIGPSVASGCSGSTLPENTTIVWLLEPR
ncbi:hypothetical protein QCA50_012647 [Cerrena zonata]|uniref:Uncharacterized protein n=1 Tax=Cerrena zonata TaxID=2478898 RepID=A0AAW0FRQ4_9APHY